MFHPEGPTFCELARQALSSTERGYDLLAPKFEFTPFRTPDTLLRPIASLLGAEGSLQSGLDLCCGTGAGMALLRPYCQRVVGIDFSQGMIEEGRRRTAQAPGNGTLEFVRGDVLDMPFDNEFDVAVCFGALGHILPRDEPRFVQQIHRALKPGGRVLFLTSEKPPIWSLTFLLSKAFNAAMHVRNWLIRPPFVMFYLTFLLPQAQRLLEAHGFQVQVLDRLYPPPLQSARLVIATKNAPRD